MIELVKSVSNRIVFFLFAVFLLAFMLGWALPVGIDKVSSLSYREYLFSTYTVFTQFGFLLFCFIIAYFINKEYLNKTILFYKLLSYNSLTFFLNKIVVLIFWSVIMIFFFLVTVSFIFGDFSLLLLMQFLLTSILIQYIIIVSLISFLSKNLLISIGYSIFYWIFSVLLVSISSKFKYVALFDASNELYGNLDTVINGNAVFISNHDSMTIVLYLAVLFAISFLIVKFSNKRWLKLGMN